MTPLAQKITNIDLARGGSLMPGLQSSDCRCFEVTAVVPLIEQLMTNPAFLDGQGSDMVFLPARYTWIEGDSGVSRIGGYLESLKDGAINITMAMSFHSDGVVRTYVRNSRFAAGDGRFIFEAGGGDDDDIRPDIAKFYAAALAVINTPRIITQRDHAPHVGMQKKIARANGQFGKFPLRPWTEILLQVSAEARAATGGQGALTGSKALHFCRSFVRIRLGKLELVRSHWRGDPSRGIVQSRYVVKSPPTP